jgi:ribonuclease Z
MKLRLLALGVVGLVAVVAACAFLFQRQIGEAVFRQAVEENVGRDRAAELPDGLHVFVCGSGSPMPDALRAGPCLGVVAGEHVIAVDAGSGGPRRLARMGFPVGRIERVYLTHLHSDHIDSLGELMLQAWVGGSRERPLPIAGPQGVEDVVAGFNAAYRIDSSYRTAHHGAYVANPAGFGGVAEIIPAPTDAGKAAVIHDQGGVKITVIVVDHAPVEPAFGYRIDYKGRSVVISGDTKYSDELVAAAKDADVLLHEALQPVMVAQMRDVAAAKGQPHLAKVMGDILDYHASPEDAARAATAANVKALVLYHIVPPLPSSLLDAAFLGDAPANYKGPIRVAEDGLLVSLPVGGGAINQSVIR